MTDTITIEFQQGGSPSPFDRNLATDLAGTAFHWLAEKAEANLTDEGKVNIFRKKFLENSFANNNCLCTYLKVLLLNFY